MSKYNFDNPISETEAEKASYAYLMSLVILMVGFPLPIINVVSTVLFFLGNNKGTYFVRWHCMQAMLSQLVLFFFNAISFWWTFSILFEENTFSNNYFAYLILVIFLNLVEFVATIYAAIQTRKGIHVVWWFYGAWTNLLCKK